MPPSEPPGPLPAPAGQPEPPRALRSGHPGRASRSSRSLDSLVAAKEIVVVCGSGGVGKTTTAAAVAAMAVVHHGGRVLVVTVDPARRLAGALGLAGIGNDATRIPAEAFAGAGVEPRGELWAAMLDTRQSWDALVRRHAPDGDTERRILQNPLYQNIAGKFVQSHDYIAMERLYELHGEARYDLIVVDTPPTRNAVDFIDAPQRMAELFSSRLLRLLIVPYRSRVVNFASRPFYQVADRVLGSDFLSDIAEFFVLFQTMYSGFVERARSVERLLRDRRTTFVVVSTLEAAAAREAELFVRALRARRLPVGALVLNRALPDYLLSDEARDGASRLAAEAEGIAGELAALVGSDPDQLGRVLREVAETYRNLRVVARAEAAQRDELGPLPDVVATAPEMEADIYDLAGLLRLGRLIWR